MYSIEIKARAVTHIQKAAQWYSKQQIDLGARFLDELEKAFEVLEINPFYAKRYNDVRGLPLNTFPFLILYKVDEKKMLVSIFAVFHTSQDPQNYPNS